MDESQKKEQFSHAYVRAVASVCGLRAAQPVPDDDSVDLILAARGGNGVVRSPKLDLQLKCTALGPLKTKELSFSLSIKNYDDLRDPAVMVPRILVVVVIPKRLDKWLLCDETQLSLHHCAYWLSLRGMVDKLGQNSVTIKLPRGQCFDVSGLDAIMNRIAQGGLP